MSRQRFDAGVSDNTEIVQSQGTVANAHLDNINSIFRTIGELSLGAGDRCAADSRPISENAMIEIVEAAPLPHKRNHKLL